MCVIGTAGIGVERYPERTKHKAPLSHFVKMTDEYFPAELGPMTTHGTMRVVLYSTFHLLHILSC